MLGGLETLHKVEATPAPLLGFILWITVQKQRYKNCPGLNERERPSLPFFHLRRHFSFRTTKVQRH